MVKRCIGIDIGPSHLRAMQIMCKGEQFCIEKVFSAQTRRSTDSPPEILRSLFSRYGFDRRADIAISMPDNAVFFRNIETDSAGPGQIHRYNPSVLEHAFPMQPDELVAQVCSYHQLSGKKYTVLAAAVNRQSLRERLNVLDEAKMHPNLIEAPIFAIHCAVVVNHPEVMIGIAIIAYVNENYLTLAVTQNNNVLIVRNIPIFLKPDDNNADSVQEQVAEVLSREAEITWQRAFGSEIQQDTKMFLVAEVDVSDGLEALVEEKLHCQTIIVDHFAKVRSSPEYKADVRMCLAEGLALRVLAPEKTTGINFLKVDNATTKPTLNLKRELVTCAVLAGAVVAVSLIGLFMRLSRLETNYAHIKKEIEEIFKATLPEEKNIVSPLVQLEQKLESFRKDYQLFASFCPTSLAPLDVLHSITMNTPSQANLKVDDLLITTESVRLSGVSDSFESVYQWQRLLREIPGFTFADVQDVQKEPQSGAIHFTILISSAQPEQK